MQKFIRHFGSGGYGTVTVQECLIKHPMHTLETGLHAEVGAKALQTFYGQRIAIGQNDLP